MNDMDQKSIWEIVDELESPKTTDIWAEVDALEDPSEPLAFDSDEPADVEMQSEVTDEPQVEVPVAADEMTDRLTGLELRFPWQERGEGFYDLSPEQAAGVVGYSAGTQNLYQGIKQLFGMDDEEYAEDQKYLKELMESEEYGTEAMVGNVAGTVLDPTAAVLAPAAAVSSARVLTPFLAKLQSAEKLSKTAKAAGSGMFTGGGWGALDYVDEGSGESRAENAALGAAMGLALGAAGGKVAEWSEIKKARKAQEKLNKDLNDLRHQVAALVKEDGMTLKEAVDSVKVDTPSLWENGAAAAKAMKERFNWGQAIRDYDTVEETMSGLYANPLGSTRKSNSVASSLDKAAGIISTRVENISPRVGGNLKRMEAAIFRRPEQLAERRAAFADYLPSKSGRKLKDASKLQFNDEEAKVLKKSLLNGDFDTARRIIGSRGSQALEAFDETIKVLDELAEEQVKLGIIDKKVDNYWPRVISRDSMEDFFDEMGKDSAVRDTWKEALEQANARSMKSRGHPLSTFEEASLFQQKFLKDNSDIHMYGAAKDRVIKKVPEKWIKYYEDPIEALDSHIHNAVYEAEKAKFLGPKAYKIGKMAEKGSSKKAGLFNMDKALEETSYLEGLDDMDQQELSELLKARFGKGMATPGQGYQWYRSLVTSTLLANPRSALTQVGDLGNAMYRNGVGRSIKSFAKSLVGDNSRVSLNDVGLETDRFTEFEDIGSNFRKNATDFVLKYSGFNTVDRLGKETLMNSALEKGMDLAKKGEGHAYRQWEKKYRRAWGNKGFQKLRGELENLDPKKLASGEQKPSDELLTYVFSELADMQPISKSEMPEPFHGKAKFLYTLKSFMLKQADVVRKDIYQKLRYGDADDVREGLQNLGKYAAMVGGANMGAGWMKSEFLGDPDKNPFKDLSEEQGTAFALAMLTELGLNTIKLFGADEYTVGKAIKEGPEAFVGEVVIPPVPGGKEILQIGNEALTGADSSEILMEKVPELRRFLPLAGPSWDAEYFPLLYDNRTPPSQIETIEAEKPEVLHYAEGGVVDPEAPKEPQEEEVSEAMPSPEEIIDEAKIVAQEPEQPEQEKEESQGAVKLEPGVYQDDDGELFTVLENGTIQMYEDSKDEAA